MKKLKKNKSSTYVELLYVDLGDILDEFPSLQKYKAKIEKADSLSLDEYIDLQISLDHIRSHCVEGIKSIEKILANLNIK